MKSKDDEISYEEIVKHCPEIKLSTLLIAEKSFAAVDTDKSGDINAAGTQACILFYNELINIYMQVWSRNIYLVWLF